MNQQQLEYIIKFVTSLESRIRRLEELHKVEMETEQPLTDEEKAGIPSPFGGQVDVPR